MTNIDPRPPPEDDATPVSLVAPSTVPVAIVAPDPIPVEVVGKLPAAPALKARPIQYQQSQTQDPSVPARTTFQEDLTTAGQRRVNLIWEYTQAIIALLVVFATMACGLVAMIDQQKQIPTIIGVAFGMVTGFYFSRTNHQAIGGTGKKANEDQSYQGR